LEDVEIAIDIMFDSIVLKVDELDGSLRQFYEKLKEHIQKTGGIIISIISLRSGRYGKR